MPMTRPRAVLICRRRELRKTRSHIGLLVPGSGLKGLTVSRKAEKELAGSDGGEGE